MEYKNIVEKILGTLNAHEEQGELVIISTMPEIIARDIFHTAIEEWLKGLDVEHEPVECTMPYLLDQTCSKLSHRFAIELERAREIIDAYYTQWCKTRSIKEIAEIYWHETPSEMAKRAYWSVVMKKPDNRNLDYLEWRKQC
ncbi:hypothetical protein [Gynuella sunshinyii]|uniref:Uncharacterized protein n=1 Tax=Gynuella sunshinyii YC6258 TaxID=1445510 RepID=A0A0C5VUV2_9GAMM|nr:hypothetical protein [Gynuella sunshinyii]AJQ94169.1 hypothetical Protein YC6258_02131 [Gynuella sunshinyii YC6258]